MLPHMPGQPRRHSKGLKIIRKPVGGQSTVSPGDMDPDVSRSLVYAKLAKTLRTTPKGVNRLVRRKRAQSSRLRAETEHREKLSRVTPDLADPPARPLRGMGEAGDVEFTARIRINGFTLRKREA
jgi:hypothetical protein